MKEMKMKVNLSAIEIMITLYVRMPDFRLFRKPSKYQLFRNFSRMTTFSFPYVVSLSNNHRLPLLRLHL